MQYIVRAEALYRPQERVAAGRIRGRLVGPRKRIFLREQERVLVTDIREREHSAQRRGDVRCREYVLLDEKGQSLAWARPDYAREEDPEIHGWPMYRAPLVDHASLQVGKDNYLLTRQDAGRYLIQDDGVRTVMKVTRRGVRGDWVLEGETKFSEGILCGVYAFCRYLEHENEVANV